MRKNLKKIVVLLMIAGVIAISFAGCSLFKTITVKVTNYYGFGVSVYYRESGSSEWIKAISYLSSDASENFDLPSSGTYDFKVEDWVDHGGHLSVILENKDCTIDLGDISDYDYSITIFSDGEVSW